MTDPQGIPFLAGVQSGFSGILHFAKSSEGPTESSSYAFGVLQTIQIRFPQH